MNIIIAGDFCDCGNVSDKIIKGEYPSMFDDVKPLIEKADFSVVNFEFPIVLKEGRPIAKCGPNLKGSKESVYAIKYAGFNICTLANNHILDQGADSCMITKHILEDEGLKTVGVGNTIKEASAPLYVTKEGETLAIVNCCEHEYSIVSERHSGANPINAIQQYYKIKEARKNADYVIVIVHGGHEMYQLPSPRMKELYRFYIDCGADAVVNHHQHCFSGYEIYNKRPIFYGLGNFLFDNIMNADLRWNDGYMVEISLNRDQNSFNIHPYNQSIIPATIKLLDEREYITFENAINKLNAIIADDDELSRCFKEHADNIKNGLIPIFLPYNNRYLNALCKRGLLPSFLSKNKKLRIVNYLNCESHLDCLREVVGKL